MQMQMIVKERLLEFRDYLGLNTQTLEAQRLAGEVLGFPGIAEVYAYR